MSVRPSRSATPPLRRQKASEPPVVAAPQVVVPPLALGALPAAVPAVRTPRSSPTPRETPRARSVTAGSSSEGLDVANVRVVCRLRPMSEKEKALGTVPVCTSSTERREMVVARMLGGRQVRTAFNFDAVLGSFSTQEDVFNSSVKPLIEQVLSGYDATAFAYGQTGTGKTYTMEGDQDSADSAGLMPRAAATVLEALSHSKYLEHTVTMSYLEIYNEELSDLLAPAQNQKKLELMDTGGSSGVCCIGLLEVPVQTLDDITQLVKAAQEKKRMAETRMNARSSRSHCIFTMKVTCRKQVSDGELATVGKLHLVDLAGSECAKKASLSVEEASLQRPGQAGGVMADQERERRNINQSLLTLGRVIGALRENTGRVPYRDSKLTRLLKDALGGNCKTVLIATISPALAAVEETISTLTYAEQANGIQNKPVATSFLRMTRMPGEARGELSGSSVSGCNIDWAEAEMKIRYLTQEVEEAQSALARKHYEMQELMDRAETAEQEADVAKAQASAMQDMLASSAAAHTRSANAARALVAELRTAARTSAAAREEEARQLAELRGQRFIEEQVVTMLQQHRQELHHDILGVQKELEGAKTELVSTKTEMKELQTQQEQRLSEAMQATVKFMTVEFTKVSKGLTDGVEKANAHMDEVCTLIDSSSSSASAAAARSAGAGQKVVDAITTGFNELHSKHDACHQQACQARCELEAATSNAGSQLSDTASLCEDAATAASTQPGHANEESTLKENQGLLSGKIIEKKTSSDSLLSQGPQRTALKEVN